MKKKNYKQQALFEERFVETLVGKNIISNPKVAIVELIANAWDAGATKVQILWPLKDGQKFSVKDNGHGMSESQFSKRFVTLAYDRIKNQGIYADIPDANQDFISKRPAFGKNGVGRFAGFCFGATFQVKTTCYNSCLHYQVLKESNNNLAFKLIGSNNQPGHGTEIFVNNSIYHGISLDEIKSEIGMRFAADPSFEVFVNQEKVSFLDIPSDNIENFYVEIPKIGKIEILVIDVKKTDKTAQLHGIAWQVKNRLVGECTWKHSGNEYLIDGRRIAAKRYIFIVKADCLEKFVTKDWTGFKPFEEDYQKAFSAVQEAIKNHLLNLTQASREVTFKNIQKAVKPLMDNVGLISKEKWEMTIEKIQEECPSISEQDLEKVGKLLISLEQTESKYQLIEILASSTKSELQDLTEILSKWDISFAKLVLDEIEFRLELIEKLHYRIFEQKHVDELHDLQPLFHNGLWIFGPRYETIEYTSNRGMTKVIQDLFKSSDTGSKNRPDFAILEKSSVGFYSYPEYDDDGEEVGIDRLTIVELKSQEIPIGDLEISQAWKYVVELRAKGLLKKTTKVMCFVLGYELNPNEAERVMRGDNNEVVIQPMSYNIVIKRAKSRLLKLYDKVKNAPFLEQTRILELLREKEQRLF
jgi:hypothetical protein